MKTRHYAAFSNDGVSLSRLNARDSDTVVATLAMISTTRSGSALSPCCAVVTRVGTSFAYALELYEADTMTHRAPLTAMLAGAER